MTASVTGYSIIHGLASTLDTMLPSAWTSSQPQLVGLWAQRMGGFASRTTSYHILADTFHFSCSDGWLSNRTSIFALVVFGHN